jgi:CRAL/TRIO domain
MADSYTFPDVYGQVHPIESDELVQRKLQELETHLAEIAKTAAAAAYGEAQTKCPQLIANDFKLVFLRCEQFNAKLATERFVQYWEKRVEIFGAERAFLPLTLQTTSGALDEDDKAALRHGFVRLVPAKDPVGRAILFADSSRQEANKNDRLRTVRAMWYVMHAALEDVETQKVGVVLISDPRKAKFSQTDSKLDQLMISSIRGCLPVRVSGIHLCHMPTFFSIIFPIIKVFLGQKLRQRITLHQGSVEHVLDRLQAYGLTRDHLPEQLGGTVPLDQEKWVDDRMKAGL